MSVSLSNLTKSKIPVLPFSRIAREILGRNFNLSVVICGNSLSGRLNLRRGKFGSTNVLSFKLSQENGEIFLNGPKIREEARLFGKTIQSHAFDLYLHGLLHLADYSHGRKMNEAVHKFSRRFRPQGV